MSTDTMQVYLEARRQAEEDRARVAAWVARQKTTEAAINAAISLYVAQITAPWQALADQMRSEMGAVKS